MIPVPRVPMPEEWPVEAEQKGRAWLAKHPIADRNGQFRPYNYWSRFLEELGEGFGWLCGYTATYLDNGTIDHFIPWEDLEGTADEWRAYDWENLRYSAGWFNSARKRTEVPDPYEVQPGWFRLVLPGLYLEATDKVPATQKLRVDNALRWLKNDRRVMRHRRKWYEMYKQGKISLSGLDEVAPMISEALRRQPEYQCKSRKKKK